MIIFLTLIYSVFAVVTALAGICLSCLEYNFVKGHYNKKLLLIHIVGSIVIGLLWLPVILLLCIMILYSIIID